MRSIKLANYASYFAALYQESPKDGELDGSITISSAANLFKLEGNLVLTELRTLGDGNLARQGWI